MKKLIFALLLFTSCKAQHLYIFQPGDTVNIRNTKFLILDYNKSRKGFFYKAQDLKRGYFVEYFSQEHLKKREFIYPEKTYVKSKYQSDKGVKNK